MKIGVYTDVHCSYTSSILPLKVDNSKYTARLKMIVDTFKWMYQLFDDIGVDLIVNCGDLFDSYKVRAEELSAMAEALSYSKGVEEYHIIGNHEMYDKRRSFYATALLSNYKNITLVDQPLKLENGLSFLPYMPWSDAQDILPLLKNNILFSHIDIQGSRVTPTYVLEDGVDSLKLSNIFRLVINGHIHAYQKLNQSVYNIGATTSTSFSDDSNYSPGVTIVDTDSLFMQHYDNPHAIRFRKLDVTSRTIEKACEELDGLSVIRCDVNFEDKERVTRILSECDKVAAFRLNVINKETSYEPNSSDTLELNSDLDIEFCKFLRSCKELKYPLSDYENVVSKLQSKEA